MNAADQQIPEAFTLSDCLMVGDRLYSPYVSKGGRQMRLDPYTGRTVTVTFEGEAMKALPDPIVSVRFAWPSLGAVRCVEFTSPLRGGQIVRNRSRGAMLRAFDTATHS
jgi:hypothetical protein